ncbi:hypothetical protein [Corallococcus macrosporus]|uniref:HEAT repeat domain-containing protein n=1 Tax=Corallococcus macrosporus DSM 14697 TaxID=1189310 RepID=A0A250JMU1_9BACT|nr:hypothetical protein [Corallococcus macrosporus]ATB44983.1 hypothetical protein MYMAC_000566 [Corallococcus macrosporus DSM 14697]
MTPESLHRSAAPATGAPGRRVPRKALAWLAGTALLVAGVALLSSREPGGDAAASAHATAAASARKATSGGPGHGGRAGAGGAADEAPPPPRFDEATCWRELERFDAAVTLESFRAWAAPLLASGDPLVADYLTERLTELIGQDPERASEVLSWARAAGPDEFEVLLTALRGSEAVHHAQVATKLLAQGMDATLDGGRRAGLLSALDTQKRFEPAALDTLTSFAKDAVSGEAGWAATRTIARVMKRDFEAKGDAAPYMDALLTIGTESPDEQIRYLALSTPMHATPVLDEDTRARYAKVLTQEGSPDGREAAAHNLSVSGDSQEVLDMFAQAFAREQDTCVRWALFRFAARASGRDALPVMANMAMTDPRFQPLYQVFEQLYASGVHDFVRLWNSLPDQDPFHCLVGHD